MKNWEYYRYKIIKETQTKYPWPWAAFIRPALRYIKHLDTGIERRRDEDY